MMHIAFLGPKGSYSHIAAIKYANYHFDKVIECSCQNFSDIFNLVTDHQAEYGILPIENSNSGLIDEVCNLLIHTQLTLVGEITIPIQHQVLVSTNTSLKKIQTIYSHPQPALQCSKFLKKFSQWKIIFCKSSSLAIKKVAYLKQSNLAALGSTQGGEFYGLKPLIPSMVSNCYFNNTRFIILKNKNFLIQNTTKISGKIMLILSINYHMQELSLILNTLQLHNIKISFLRLHKLFNINKNIMILEIIANFNNFHTQQALIKIRRITQSLKILGCYPSILNSVNKSDYQTIYK